MKIDFDIDIDMADREAFLAHVPHVTAMQHKNSQPVKHNTGVYFQNIPHWPVENISTIDYKTAEQQGFFKVDFLNNNIYKDVDDNQQLDRLVNTEPMWDLLEHREIVQQLYHINNHYELVREYKPRSVEQLAMVLALIRPAKKHLIGKTYSEMEKEIWTPPRDGGYYFKKSHSIAFAMAIVVQMNLLVSQASQLF